MESSLRPAGRIERMTVLRYTSIPNFEFRVISLTAVSSLHPVVRMQTERPPLSLLFAPPVGAIAVHEDVSGAGPGGALWDGSVALAQHVAATYADGGLAGQRVVELGAGTGVPGLVAAKLGASVVLTDRARALPLLRRNAELNSLSVSVQELEWSRRGCAALLAAGPLHLVLAAECIAHEESFDVFRDTLLALSEGGATILLANKCRDMREHGWWKETALQFEVSVLACGTSDLDRDGDGLPITIYELRRRAVS